LRLSVLKRQGTAPNGTGGSWRLKTTSDKRNVLLIADFCNKIGQKRTSAHARAMPAVPP
jgi:hypothetical protein